MMPQQLFVPAKDGWVAFFRNGLDGADPSGPIGYLAQLMQIDSMRVCVTPEDATYPAVVSFKTRRKWFARKRPIANEGTKRVNGRIPRFKQGRNNQMLEVFRCPVGILG